MNKKVMKRWVKALRSGKYKQAQSSLTGQRKDGSKGFCCLGVLCELAKKSKAIKDYDGTDGFPRPDVWQNFAGMNSEQGTFYNPYSDGGYVGDPSKRMGVLKKNPKFKSAHTLAALNDKGATFKQIARFIEDNYENL